MQNISTIVTISTMITIKADWDRIRLAFGILILISVAYFVQLDVRMGVVARRPPLFELVYQALALVIVVLNFTTTEHQTTFIILSAILTVIAYYQLFLRLILFDKTAVFISIIFYIVRDIIIFTLVILLLMTGYGIAFYVASGLQTDGTIPYFGENLG